MRRIVRLDLALLILLWSVGPSLFIFADSLRRPIIPQRESRIVQDTEYFSLARIFRTFWGQLHFVSGRRRCPENELRSTWRPYCGGWFDSVMGCRDRWSTNLVGGRRGCPFGGVEYQLVTITPCAEPPQKSGVGAAVIMKALIINELWLSPAPRPCANGPGHRPAGAL